MDEANQRGWKSVDLIILLAGLASSAAALAGVFFLARAHPDFSIMGWYALFVIPAGAIAVGLAAGSGYGLGCWLAGRKLNGLRLGAILALLLGAWGTAQWLSFASLHLVHLDGGTPVGFFEYFDATTRSITLTFGHGSTGTGELGLFGYLFRLLEAVGFAGGGLAIPLALRARPYCERCQTYMRRRASWWFAAAPEPGPVSRKDPAARAARDRELQAALEDGRTTARALLDSAGRRDLSAFQAALAAALPAKQAAKREARIEARLLSCPHCADGHLSVALGSGRGDKTRVEKIGVVTLDGGFTRSLALPGRGKG